MATVAVQVTQTPSDSSMPADKTVNVLHFDGGTDYESIGNAMLGTFSGGDPSGTGAFTLYEYATLIEVRVYDLADEKPRPERWYGSVAPGGGGSYGPRLLAPVLSFYSGRNIPRSRGRIFVGPLQAGVIDGEQISSTVMGQCINLARGIYATDGGTWNHVVYSQVLSAPTPTITNYFVSSKWGVQHSRSMAQQSRSTYTP